MRLIGAGVMAFGVFLSGFVMSEPAPYELLMVAQIAVWFLLGLKISRPVGLLLALLLVFNVGGFLSLTVMKANFGDGFIYIAVSLFLALSSVFYAAAIEDSHTRLRLMFQAWVGAGVITALLGILGYFHAFPGAEAFTRFDRAKGAFQDSNVFGPFLVAPALYLMHGLLTQRLSTAQLRVAGLLILVLGIFLSFSRAAWGLFAFAAVALVVVMLLKERSGAFRVKILLLSLAALVAMVAALVIAIQSDQVAQLLSSRTKLVQDYDGGHLGRFARHKIGFLMALEKPLGIGPLVFATIFPEDEHNTWLKALTTYGWLGFAAFIAMTISTIYGGLRILLRDRPWQPFLMIAWITYLGHALIGNVIDTDHWRHFYILIGIIWGCIALEWRHERAGRILR
ncbi:O-antigen ligase family protein [Rhizobiaceae bacterium BDR2-2]|uniref:O-antigen ligase family protein n=1 Tax=Ectorhizobium quercum TaxID=2965071 RepID=A0AAE3SWA2_9HYPH|nr:O-antigen ligase family protein [Ectorhizobium quercum]MCX8998962.1 O-antigen ligase family protein [Ectorhizobium quercum]